MRSSIAQPAIQLDVSERPERVLSRAITRAELRRPAYEASIIGYQRSVIGGTSFALHLAGTCRLISRVMARRRFGSNPSTRTAIRISRSSVSGPTSRSGSGRPAHRHGRRVRHPQHRRGQRVSDHDGQLPRGDGASRPVGSSDPACGTTSSPPSRYLGRAGPLVGARPFALDFRPRHRAPALAPRSGKVYYSGDSVPTYPICIRGSSRCDDGRMALFDIALEVQ
jgi:hypothetical protein